MSEPRESTPEQLQALHDLYFASGLNGEDFVLNDVRPDFRRLFDHIAALTGTIERLETERNLLIADKMALTARAERAEATVARCEELANEWGKEVILGYESTLRKCRTDLAAALGEQQEQEPEMTREEFEWTPRFLKLMVDSSDIQHCDVLQLFGMVDKALAAIRAERGRG